MQSKATTVKQYLAELPEDRRAPMEAVRKTVLKNIDKGFEEGMQYGMIGWYVPHKIFPAGYHCDPKQPLPFACLASQKNYMSLYLMPAYGEDAGESWFRDQWAKTGKKLDMGKCCIRFRKLEDLALDVIAEAIRRVPLKTHLEHYETVLKKIAKAKPKPKARARKAVKPGAMGKKAKSSAKKKVRA